MKDTFLCVLFLSVLFRGWDFSGTFFVVPICLKSLVKHFTFHALDFLKSVCHQSQADRVI